MLLGISFCPKQKKGGQNHSSSLPQKSPTKGINENMSSQDNKISYTNTTEIHTIQSTFIKTIKVTDKTNTFTNTLDWHKRVLHKLTCFESLGDSGLEKTAKYIRTKFQ